MQDRQAVATLHSPRADRRRLWKAAIKWPMYSVAVMPLLLAVGWRLGAGLPVRWAQALGFLLAAVLLLLWENLSNDLFDADTGVDATAKPHSVVALLGRRRPVRRLSTLVLLAGLLLMLLIAVQSSLSVLALVLVSCGMGYLYQGPPFRLGYLGLGEPLCWMAFGPFATAAALLVVAPSGETARWALVPWDVALLLGSGPALATTLVLFCSHFHQIEEDAAHGKRSPVVRLGTARASSLVPWFVAGTLALEWTPVLHGDWPPTALLGALGLPAAVALIRLLRVHHAEPERIQGSKFLALRFQGLNGLGLSIGLAIGPWFGASIAWSR